MAQYAGQVALVGVYLFVMGVFYLMKREERREHEELVRREMVARSLDERITELLGNVPTDSARWRVWSVWRLREQGFPVDDIAAYLQISVEAVQESLRMARIQLGRGIVDLEEERSLDLSRVDRLLQVYMQHAEAGDLQSANLVYRLLSYREKLLNLGRINETDVSTDFWKRVSQIIDVSASNTVDAGNEEMGGVEDAEYEENE